MKKVSACVLVACLLLTAGGGVRFTAAQDSTAAPGQPTQARVWIQNRSSAEAVPVNIQSQAAEAPPLRVQVVDGQPTTGQMRQIWEYRTVTVPPRIDPTALLSAAGADGWEVTGLALQAPNQNGTFVVLKRAH